MIETKTCETCKKEYERKTHHSRERWERSKYCSQTCQRKSIGGWNKGKTDWMSEEGKRKLADKAKRYINNETQEQRTQRMSKVIQRRTENGVWKHARLGNKGSKDPNWLGDKASYNGKHRWIQNNWKKTGKCQDCGAKPRPFGNRKYGTEWANLDQRYDRDKPDTWRELCVSCHRKMDKGIHEPTG